MTPADGLYGMFFVIVPLKTAFLNGISLLVQALNTMMLLPCSVTRKNGTPCITGNLVLSVSCSNMKLCLYIKVSTWRDICTIQGKCNFVLCFTQGCKNILRLVSLPLMF
jgi:hypothetical protein